MMAERTDLNDIDPTDAAKALGRLGGLKGGKARANSLTPERRKEIAQKAIKARWDKHRAVAEPVIPNATHGSSDHPLKIGDIEIPCYVLEDGRRVITHSGMISSLGMSKGGGSNPSAGDRLARFATGKLLEPFATKDLRAGTEPILFHTPNGILAYGYEATILADLCEMVLAARQAGVLQKQQYHIAQRCEILVRGFARVGIIALVDEATGYQYARARKALEDILEEFISKELVKWAKMFPDDFYREMFRLRQWQYTPNSTRRPVHAAKLTIDLIYKRLAPGVLHELQKLTPRNDKGRLKQKLFQRLTEDVGHPRLREHLASVIALMRAFDTWEQFYRKLDRVFPKFNDTPLLKFMDDDQQALPSPE
jgi:hypothetical protein